jgi:hypothetical protein
MVQQLKTLEVAQIFNSYGVAFHHPSSLKQPVIALAVAIACRFSTRVRLMAALPVESIIGWSEAGKQLRRAQQEAYPRQRKHQQQHPSSSSAAARHWQTHSPPTTNAEDLCKVQEGYC